MVPSAFLRAFVPLDALEADEIRTVASSGEDGRHEWRQLASGHLGVMVPARPEPGWRLDRPEGVLLCPSRVRLRALVGMLALRDQYPDAIASSFVTDEQAGEAAHELESLRYSGRLRTHVLQSPWQVPLGWFVPFAPADRRVDGDRRSLTYETPVAAALERTERAVEIMNEASLPEELVDVVADLSGWIADFGEDGSILQLDYGDLALVMSRSELGADESAQDVWESLDALEQGDWERSSEVYVRVNERWSGIRALENAN